jgi:hypothetical protein
MNNEDLTIIIDRYLAGEMSVEERRDFDKQIQADPQLQKEVRLQENIRRAFKRMPDMQLRQHLDNLLEGHKDVFNEPLNASDIDPEFLAMADELNGEIKEPPKSQPIIEEKTTPIVELKPNWLKKNSVWWAAAASIALVVAVGIWWIQRDNSPQMPIVQTPTTVLPSIDTLKKIDVPKQDEKIVTVPQNGSPQYPTPQKPKTEVTQQGNLPNSPTETTLSDAAVFAEVKTVVDYEREKILEPTRGAQSSNISSLSREDQNLLKALEAIVAHKPNNAIDLLQNQDSEKARYYRALAYLATDRAKGKSALQTLANDMDLEPSFRNKIKDLLSKIK